MLSKASFVLCCAVLSCPRSSPTTHELWTTLGCVCWPLSPAACCVAGHVFLQVCKSRQRLMSTPPPAAVPTLAACAPAAAAAAPAATAPTVAATGQPKAAQPASSKGAAGQQQQKLQQHQLHHQQQQQQPDEGAQPSYMAGAVEAEAAAARAAQAFRAPTLSPAAQVARAAAAAASADPAAAEGGGASQGLYWDPVPYSAGFEFPSDETGRATSGADDGDATATHPAGAHRATFSTAAAAGVGGENTSEGPAGGSTGGAHAAGPLDHHQLQAQGSALLPQPVGSAGAGEVTTTPSPATSDLEQEMGQATTIAGALVAAASPLLAESRLEALQLEADTESGTPLETATAAKLLSLLQHAQAPQAPDASAPTDSSGGGGGTRKKVMW